MPVCERCRIAYLDSETHVCAGSGNGWPRAFVTLSGVEIYFGSLFVSINGASAYFSYRGDATWALALLVVLNIATLAIPIGIVGGAFAPRSLGSAGLVSLWVIAAIAGCLQVLVSIKVFGF